MVTTPLRLAVLASSIIPHIHSTPLDSTSQLNRRQSCQGQSCIIADLSGSSGLPYTGTKEPVFPQQGQECCIIHYNPSVASQLYAQVSGLEASCPTAPILQPLPVPDLSGTCKSKILIFAAGTSQPTEEGGDLGTYLQDEFERTTPGEWHVEGIPYIDNIDGINCLGMHGGVTGSQMIAAYLSTCPGSAIFVGGYSQGAMVARNAVGNSTNADAVSAVITFGDVFNGSPIKGYSGPIKITCHQGDYVCNGLPEVTSQHLNYDQDIASVAAYMNSVQVASAAAVPSSTSSTSEAASTSAAPQLVSSTSSSSPPVPVSSVTSRASNSAVASSSSTSTTPKQLPAYPTKATSSSTSTTPKAPFTALQQSKVASSSSSSSSNASPKPTSSSSSSSPHLSSHTASGTANPALTAENNSNGSGRVQSPLGGSLCVATALVIGLQFVAMYA